jgi:hypothetical protein
MTGPQALTSALVPGASALARGRTAVGTAALSGALACAALAALGALRLPELPPHLAAWAVAGYAGVAALAALAERAARARALDPQAVREAHRLAAAAWLRGRPEALERALALTRLAPAERGAWELLALVARAREARRELRLAERALAALTAAEP